MRNVGELLDVDVETIRKIPPKIDNAQNYSSQWTI